MTNCQPQATTIYSTILEEYLEQNAAVVWLYTETGKKMKFLVKTEGEQEALEKADQSQREKLSTETLKQSECDTVTQ